VRAAAIETTVVGAHSDTLVTTDHCRRAAALLGARYQELPVEGGHLWMLTRWPVLAEVLEQGSARPPAVEPGRRRELIPGTNTARG
jgi:surfactin synthase thioesterase subunit